jgi:Phage capsid family
MRTTTTLPSIDDLRRRFRSAANRRALQELASECARALRQVDEEMNGDDAGADQTLAGLFASLKLLMDEISSKIDRQALLDDLTTRQAPPRDRADRAFEASKFRYELRGMILRQLGHEVPSLDLGPSIEISSEIRRRSPRAFRGIPVPVEALHLSADYYVRSRRTELRADTISTGLPAAGPGSNLIPTILDAGMYVDALRSRSVIRQAGATVLSGMVGNYDIPKMSQTTQVSWFSEGNPIARPEPQQFTRVNFVVKHCGAIIAYSIDLLLNSTPSVEMLIRDDLSKLLAFGHGPGRLGRVRAEQRTIGRDLLARRRQHRAERFQLSQQRPDPAADHRQERRSRRPVLVR